MTHDGLRRSSSPATASLEAKVGRLVIDPCVMNASGPLCTYDHELWPLAASGAGAVVLKSATFEPRAGNPEPRLFTDPERGTSINSNGLCNLGFEGHAEQVMRLRAEYGKPVIASLAALEPAQFVPMARRLGAVASAIEVNLSCPNLPGKPQIAFDFEMSRRVLGEVRAATSCDVWVKLPPYQDRRLVETMAGFLREAGVQAAVCINSPSGLDIDFAREETCIHPNDGMGGAGGADITRIARWNVRRFSIALDGSGIAVLGVGGVASGRDAYGHVLAGAAAVQIGTAYLIEGAGIFDRIRAELETELASRGARRVADKVGALRVRAAGEPNPRPGERPRERTDDPVAPLSAKHNVAPKGRIGVPTTSSGGNMHEDAVTTHIRTSAAAPPAVRQATSAPFVDRLRAGILSRGPVCFGMDPDLERLPHGDVADFYLRILGRMHARDALPAMVKPNLAYYERLGESGSEALARILDGCRALGVLVLLDGKRGDIDRSAAAYAESLFGAWGADAVTVSPYMGGDSVAPFSAWCARGRGVFVLCRTSNRGAADLQDLRVEGRPLFLHVADLIAGAWWRSGVGAVVGATAPAELELVAKQLRAGGRDVPLLIPGIGAQGGSTHETFSRLRAAGYDASLCAVSASSSIAYAFRDRATHDFADAATDAFLRLREEAAAP